ncbi:glucosaminidase domain-containing protein [Thiomicrospira sp. WB1]|uniref:glucosaminidase domain-containing protein n=1 Tax=Thiomicrospira sp. WB1 TaxID=1685380 RepID=UPI0007461678|nr:glucosaminidase domain-containing protein [Thiomicrospira sp. WB1]KUJ72424.1 hypothetical protein AVO41_00990 [Thiomicrospira sp. WB1]
MPIKIFPVVLILLLHGCSDESSEPISLGSAQDIHFKSPPDFLSFRAGIQRKNGFFNYFVPLIHEANRNILLERQRLTTLMHQDRLGPSDQTWLTSLAERYDLADFNPGQPSDQVALLKRIDIIPTSLALAQAANESAWGTSRFARQANNYFGQWCYTPGCGLVPKQRNAGASHEVRAFDHPFDSVKSYLHNLNSHRAYSELRSIRAQQRQAGQPITGLALAEGLKRYSERGEHYVEELQAMIRYNELFRFNQYNQTANRD